MKEETMDGRTSGAGMEENSYLDGLAEKMDELGLAEESYVNQISRRLEPILGEEEENNQEAGGNPEADSTRFEADKIRPERMKAEKSEMSKKERPFYKDPVVWVVLLLTAAVVSVILKSGFYTDDVVLSYQSKYFVWASGTDIGTCLRITVQNWLEMGRFFPISNIYVTLLMHYLNSAFVYKLLILLFVVLDVYVFGAFIRRLTGSRSFSLLAMVVVPICFQIRAYHDGLIAYHLLMQVVLLLLLLTAMTLQQFLESKKKRWLIVSLVLYTIGLLTYEASYISIFLLCFLVFFYEAKRIREAFCRRNVKRTFFVILPYFLIMVVLFATALGVKEAYGLSYDGIKAEFVPWKMFTTTVKQIVASIPMSYHLYCNDKLGHIFHNNPIAIIKTARIWDFPVVLLTMVVMYRCLRAKWKPKRALSLVGIGLTLVLAPAVLIGISAKYQQELFLGIGHIPVYLEYFGITILGTMLVCWLLGKVKKERLRSILAGFCSVVAAFVLLVQIQDNRTVIEILNEGYLYSRQLLDESLEDGVLSELEDGSILMVENEPIYLGYPGKEYFSYKTKKHLEVYRMAEFLAGNYPADTRLTILSYDATKEQQVLTLKEAVYSGGNDGDLEIKSIYTWEKK